MTVSDISVAYSGLTNFQKQIRSGSTTFFYSFCSVSFNFRFWIVYLTSDCEKAMK